MSSARSRPSRDRETSAGPIASHRSGPTTQRTAESGFTVGGDTADTIHGGLAEAGHDQSGNVGGRGSTVPRFENPNRSARQAVPPLRQAQGVLHALYLEAAGQPGTAPRPLLPVPSRGARRDSELCGSRRLDSAGRTSDDARSCLAVTRDRDGQNARGCGELDFIPYGDDRLSAIAWSCHAPHGSARRPRRSRVTTVGTLCAPPPRDAPRSPGRHLSCGGGRGALRSDAGPGVAARRTGRAPG